MVNLLSCEGRHAEAERLEALWNALLAGNAFSLYCGYRLDLFGNDVDEAALNAIMRSHKHVLAGPRTMLSRACA